VVNSALRLRCRIGECDWTNSAIVSASKSGKDSDQSAVLFGDFRVRDELRPIDTIKGLVEGLVAVVRLLATGPR